MQQEILDAFVTVVGPALVTLAGTLATWGLYQLNNWLKSKVHDAKFQCATNRLTHIVASAVEEAQQTTVEKLKAKDSGWNEETAKTVRDSVVDIVKRQIGPQGMKELKGCLGVEEDVIESRIRTLIESYLLKRKETSAPNTPPRGQEGLLGKPLLGR